MNCFLSVMAVGMCNSICVAASEEKMKCGYGFSFLGSQNLLITKETFDCHFTPKRDRTGHYVKIVSHSISFVSQKTMSSFPQFSLT